MCLSSVGRYVEVFRLGRIGPLSVVLKIVHFQQGETSLSSKGEPILAVGKQPSDEDRFRITCLMEKDLIYNKSGSMSIKRQHMLSAPRALHTPRPRGSIIQSLHDGAFLEGTALVEVAERR